MRVSEDRYTRDLRRIQLAKRLIEFNVRTAWICAWTGFTVGRVRNLYRSYNYERIKRWRGPSPSRSLNFLRSPLLHSEASAIAGLAYCLGVIPAEPIADPKRMFATLEAAERMVFVFDLYRRIVQGATMSMEQLILLVFVLAAQGDLELGRCEGCQGVLVVDRLGANRRRCPSCRKHGDLASDLIEASGAADPADDPANDDPQRSLF